ncbi:MAG: 50S ribosomal protein L25 [Candidatus Paceibacterota bacterium]
MKGSKSMPAKKSQKQTSEFLLLVDKRDILGKKVRKLRNDGLIPANIYGEAHKSQAISLKNLDFLKTYRKTGETQVIHLKLGNNDIPVLIHNVQLHPVTDNVLHIDFRRVDLTKKTQTEVPLKTTGEAQAIVSKTGDLLHLAESVLVEALPTDIPSEIEVDISGLKAPGDEIKISDLPVPNKVSIIDETDKVVVKIVEHKEEKAEAEIPETEVETSAKEDDKEKAEDEAKESAEEQKHDTEQKKGEKKEEEKTKPEKKPEPDQKKE